MRVNAGRVKVGQSLGRDTGSADLRISYLLGNKDFEVWPRLKFVFARPNWNIKFVSPRYPVAIFLRLLGGGSMRVNAGQCRSGQCGSTWE